MRFHEERGPGGLSGAIRDSHGRSNVPETSLKQDL